MAEPPFDVAVHVPPCCRADAPLQLRIVVTNRRWSPEHLQLAVAGAATAAASADMAAMDASTGSGSSAVSSSSSGGAAHMGSSGSSGGGGESGFLVVGSTRALLDVPPRGHCTVRLALLPLRSGFAALPHVKVTWERNAATVAEVGAASAPRLIFVRP